MHTRHFDTDTMRRDAEAIFRTAVAAVEPAAAVRNCLHMEGTDTLCCGQRRIPLPAGRLLIVGAGKAAAPMAAALEDLLGERIDSGLVVTKDGHGLPLERIRVLEAAHPVPDQRGQQAAEEIRALVAEAARDEMIITLLSGGGSALLPLPAAGLSLADKIAVTDLLLASGAEIDEINCVRKHLSAIKGGQLARAASPARMLTLIISDVIGDPIDVIASGPTVADPSSYAEALAIIKRYRLDERCPRTVLQHLQRGKVGLLAETPGKDEFPPENHHSIIAGNGTALAAAADKAEQLGYRCLRNGTAVRGEAREQGVLLAKQALQEVSTPTCLLAGGETTVSLRGSGRGGRNQEFALAAALVLEGHPGRVLLAAGTDGTDGPTEAAGAIVDGDSLARGRAAGYSPQSSLDNNDSYRFHRASGDLLVTGPTRTNVMDIYLALVAPGG